MTDGATYKKTDGATYEKTDSATYEQTGGATWIKTDCLTEENTDNATLSFILKTVCCTTYKNFLEKNSRWGCTNY